MVEVIKEDIFLPVFMKYNSGIKLSSYEKTKTYLLYYAEERQLDVEFLLSIMMVESSLCPRAHNLFSKDYGYFQINHRTGKWIAKQLGIKKYNLLDIKTNINFGTFYVKYLKDKYKTEYTILGRYNAGRRKHLYSSYINKVYKKRRGFKRLSSQVKRRKKWF